MRKYLIIYTLILLIIVPSILSSNELSFSKGIHLVNPSEVNSILDNSIVIFYSCAEGELENRLLCEDEPKYYALPNIKFNNCSLSYIDTSSINCNNTYLITFPEMQFRMYLTDIGSAKKSFVLINEQELNGSFGNAVDTAIGVWSLSQFGEKYKTEINNALNWLKLERDEQFKCWPKNGCDVFQTAKILAYLTLVDINGGKRIINDAREWLESKQNYISNINNWHLKVIADEEANCSLKFGWNDIKFKVNKTLSYDKIFIMEYGLEFNLSCSNPVSFIIENSDLEKVYTAKNTYISYKFPAGACWSSQQWQGCDLKTTIYGAMCDIESGKKAMARGTLFKQLKNHPITGKYFPSLDSTIYHSLYYTYLNPGNDVGDYILFKQNNDGSYGANREANEDDMFLTTLYATNALLHMERTSRVLEATRDAKSWLLSNYAEHENDEVNRVEKLSLWSTLFSKDSLSDIGLKVLPPIINFERKDSVVLEFYNPSNKTLTDLNFSFNNNYIAFNWTSPLIPGERRNVHISKKMKEGGIYFDVLSIVKIEKQNVSQEKILINIPILINNPIKVDITAPKEVAFMGSAGSFPLRIYSTIRLNCIVDDENKQISILTESFDVELNTTDKLIEFEINNLVRASFTDVIQIKCKPQNELMNSNYFSFPIKFEQYTSKLFSVNPQSVEIIKAGKKSEIEVKSLINERITLDISLNKTNKFFKIPPSIDLRPFERKKIVITNSLDKKQDYYSANFLIISSKFQTEVIPFTLSISSAAKSSFKGVIKTIAALILIIFFICLIYSLLKRFKDKIKPYYTRFMEEIRIIKEWVKKRFSKKE